MIKKLILSIILVFSTSNSVQAQEIYPININKFCANIVGIPYASDNFSDEEFELFNKCLIFTKQFKE